MGAQSALQRDVGGGAAHQLDEVPVFLGGVRVAFDVADEFGVDLARRIESEGGFNVGVLEVAVDGFRAADHDDSGVFRLVVFREETGVRVGVVAADDDDCRDAEGLAVDFGFFELFGRFKLGASGADHVETAGVAVGGEEIRRDFNVFVVGEAARAALEAVELRFRMKGLETVEKSGDDVVPAGRLSAGENDRDIDRLCDLFPGPRREGQQRHVAGGREFRGDFFRVGECGESVSLRAGDVGAGLEGGGKFRGVGHSGFLQSGNGAIHFSSPFGLSCVMTKNHCVM